MTISSRLTASFFIMNTQTATNEMSLNRTEERRARHHSEHPEQRPDAEVDPQRRRHIGAEPEVERVAERELPGKSHQQVPGLAGIGEIHHQDQHAELIAVGKERREKKSGEQQRGEHAAVPRHIRPQRAHARRPKRPCGRSTSTAIRSAKENMLFIDGAAKNPASASDTPISTPPSSAPAIEPSPPMMTMVNASSV